MVRQSRKQNAPASTQAVATAPAQDNAQQTGNAIAVHQTTVAAIAAIQHLAESEIAALANTGTVLEGEIITTQEVGSVGDVLNASSLERPVEDPDDDMTETEEDDDDQAEGSVLDPAINYEGQSLTAITDGIADKDRKRMATKIGKAFDDRSAYETEKNKNNERIHKELNKHRAKLAMPGAAAILLAAQVPADFINRSVSEGSRFNVYAADKLADLVKALETGAMKNKVNIAVCKSMFRFRAAGESFTGEMAKAAVCDKVTVNTKMQKLLTRHTVDPGTMSTQTSSTMTALMTLGIVKNTGTFRAPVYELTDTPQTARLQEVIAA